MPDIEDLIPHRPPMRLLDELLEHDAQATVCRLRITPTSSFLHGGRVPALLAVEYTAECIAAHSTLASSAGVPHQPRIGYLIGIRRFELHRSFFALGDELLVTATHVWGTDEGAVFRGEVRAGGAVAADGDLTVALAPRGMRL